MLYSTGNDFFSKLRTSQKSISIVLFTFNESFRKVGKSRVLIVRSTSHRKYFLFISLSQTISRELKHQRELFTPPLSIVLVYLYSAYQKLCYCKRNKFQLFLTFYDGTVFAWFKNKLHICEISKIEFEQ